LKELDLACLSLNKAKIQFYDATMFDEVPGADLKHAIPGMML